jgi:hypothetical protein
LWQLNFGGLGYAWRVLYPQIKASITFALIINIFALSIIALAFTPTILQLVEYSMAGRKPGTELAIVIAGQLFGRK